MSGELVAIRPLTGFDLTLINRYLSGEIANDVASGSNARFIGRQGLPPIDARGESDSPAE